MLDREQLEKFREQGYLVVSGVASASEVSALNAELDGWIEESRKHSGNWGTTADGKPVFDLEPGHSAERPRLRRVTNPADFSDLYRSVLFEGRMVDAVADLVGPDVKFHHCKINIKMPAMATYVGWHQDHPFEPHTNDSMAVCLVMLDEMTEQNGALQVVPGSHRGPLYDHSHDGVFTGAVSPEVEAWARGESVTCGGPAGSAYLMNARVLHGSAPNLSDRPRTLFIVQYHAEDAHPLAPNHLPSRFDQEVVAGVDTGRVRCSDYEVEFPETPTVASFFAVQAVETS